MGKAVSDREKKIKDLEAGIAEKEIKATTTTLQAAHEKRMSDVNRTRDEDLKKAASDREKKIKELEAGIAEKEKEIKATTTTLQAAHEKRMSDVNRTRDEDLKKAVSDREKKIKELEVELSGNCDGFISGDVWSTLFGSGNKVPVGCPEFYVDFNVSEIKWFYDRVANLTE